MQQLRVLASTGPEFNFQHSHASSQLSVTSTWGLMPFLATSDTRQACGTQTHMQTKHTYTSHK